MCSATSGSADALAELRSNPRIIDVATAPLFTPAECAQVIDSCDEGAWVPGVVGTATSADAVAGAAVVRRVDPGSKSRVEQPVPGGSRGWIAQRIATRVMEINVEVFGFRVVGFEEPMRVLCYRGRDGDHYRAHLDLGPTYSLRKLAFSVLLSDPASYAGGDLVFGKDPVVAARVQGTVAVFPAFLAHEISPVSRGSRFVVVGWAIGPAFV